MKFLQSVLFTFITFTSLAQQNMQCFVYQYPADDLSKRKLVLTQAYDDQGRVVKEVSRGFTYYLDNTNTMYSCKEDGICQHYYDTVLYKTVETYTDDITGRPVDSNKNFYYYDDAGKLVREQRVHSLRHTNAGKKRGSFRNVVHYEYDAMGNKVQQYGMYGDSVKEYFVYDGNGRLLTDSITSTDRLHEFGMVTKYEYAGNGYTEYSWMGKQAYPVITVYVLDEKKRVKEQRCYFHEGEDKTAKTAKYNWAAYLHNDFSKYKLYDRVVTRYNEAGRISERYYYFGDKHTTTHQYVYSGSL